jgi:methionyl-tRNA formyltransferase
MNNEKKYGSTVHFIDSEKIDNGKIVDVVMWKIKNNSFVHEILFKTYVNQFNQLKKVIRYIKNDNLEFLINKNKKYRWSKKLYTKKELENLYLIDYNVKKKIFGKILKSTITKKFKPYVMIHGKKFVYEN